MKSLLNPIKYITVYKENYSSIYEIVEIIDDRIYYKHVYQKYDGIFSKTRLTPGVSWREIKDIFFLNRLPENTEE